MDGFQVFFLLIVGVSFCFGIGVVEPKTYLNQVFDNIDGQLLVKSLTLDDFEGSFYSSAMNNVFNGTAKFHSGLINRIGKLTLNEQKFRNVWNDTDLLIADGLRFSDFSMLFDLDCVTDDYNTPSAMMFTFTYLEFIFEISRNHQLKKIVSTVRFDSLGIFRVEPFPSNPHTQMVVKEVNPSRGSTPLKDKLIKTLKVWADDIQKLLEKSTKEVEFAELCYYCPTPPWAS